MLEEETKKMEEKLDLVKRMMELEKEKRSTQKKAKDGTVWRSATTQKQINGYSQLVLNQHKQQQPNLPPTTMIMRDTMNEQNNTTTQKNLTGMGKSGMQA